MAGLIGSGAEDLPYLLFGAHPAAQRHAAPRVRETRHHRAQPAAQRAGAHRPRPRGPPAAGAEPNDSPCGRTSSCSWKTSTTGAVSSTAASSWSSRAKPSSGSRSGRRGRTPSSSTFSGGNQQKALLAKWLIAGPRLLLLHEPTQGVDVGARRDIYRFVKSAATLNQTAVLWVTTDFGELAEVCDRVIVLSEGRTTDDAGRRRTERRSNHRSRAAADQGGQMSASPGAPAPVETGGRDERPRGAGPAVGDPAPGTPALRDRDRVRRHDRRRSGWTYRRPSFRSATSPTSSAPRRCCSSW